MQTEILFRPSFSMTRIQLGPDEEIGVEGGAMVSMSDGITIKTKMQGGLFQSMAGQYSAASHSLLTFIKLQRRVVKST